ncbi:MAG TPA: bacillithiol biosynthesis deacetylase BshB1 [Coriobacteriia bacterium]|nr:bacillithiol biosynthesis deacetylase BshB1 [Coriobacteriia bacterium]
MTRDWLFDAVCIGAHPDDVEIGMGGTVAKMAADGLRVAIVDLTNGEPTPFGSIETRAAESAEAARILGVETRRTLTQPNRYLFDTIEARTELAQVLRELRPRMLFLPYATDAHPDHIAASSIAVAARFYSKFTKTQMTGEPFYPARVFRYMAVHMRVVAEPSFTVEISKQLDTKLEALAAYHSQFGANEKNAGIIEMMRQSAAMWGGLSNVAAAEPFFALEPIALSGPGEVL